MKTKPAQTVEPPRWLSSRAVEVFHETIEALGTKYVPSDKSVVADFAQAQADCEEWTQMVRFEGEILVSHATGNNFTNPRYTNLQARRKDLERYRDDLGMTPQARKVTITAPGKAGLMDRMGR